MSMMTTPTTLAAATSNDDDRIEDNNKTDYTNDNTMKKISSSSSSSSSSLLLLSTSPTLVISEWEEQQQLKHHLKQHQQQQNYYEDINNKNEHNDNINNKSKVDDDLKVVEEDIIDHQIINTTPILLSSSVLITNITTPTITTSNINHNINNNQSKSSKWHILSSSYKSIHTKNPIRDIVDPIMQQKCSKSMDDVDNKPFISLALGDPTAYNNPYLLPCPIAYEALRDQIDNRSTSSTASYIDACGLLSARKAISYYHTNTINEYQNVIIANGCSGALELLFTSICDNTNDSNRTIVLLPNPGFPLYSVIIESHINHHANTNTNTSILHYPLLSNHNWEIDLVSLENIIQKEIIKSNNTSIDTVEDKIDNVQSQSPHFILVINNPSNPTGVVYNKQHLINILYLCNQYHIVIITDEIYNDLTFPALTTNSNDKSNKNNNDHHQYNGSHDSITDSSNIYTTVIDDDDYYNNMMNENEHHLKIVNRNINDCTKHSSKSLLSFVDDAEEMNHVPKFIPLIQLLHELQQEAKGNAEQMEWNVPIITASGLSKQFLIPGWRMGWIMFHDNQYGTLKEVHGGVKRLAQLILGSSHLIQAIIPRLLLSTFATITNINISSLQSNKDDNDNTNHNSDYIKMKLWKNQYHNTMYQQMKCLCHEILLIPGLSIPTLPNSGMYTMVKIHINEYFNTNVIYNDISFTQLLYHEENILVLPGSCFFNATNKKISNNNNDQHYILTKMIDTNTTTKTAKKNRYDTKHFIDMTTTSKTTNEMNNDCPSIQYSIDIDHNNRLSSLSISSSSSSFHDDTEYYFRIVFCAPCEQLLIATDRIRQFCMRHQRSKTIK